VIALRDDLRPRLGRQLRHLIQERLHLEGLRPHEQVDQDLAAGRNVTRTEGFDAVVPKETH
jgi:hypothetical protein